MSLFHNLNPAQLEAVETLQGPLLVLAGAGSGKTRVVTFRIINLINQGTSPHQILGLTFTNKAAEEMKERVRSLTQSQVLICTFHSLGARVLRESITALGYSRDFTIYDEADIEKVLKTCIAELEIKEETKKYRALITKAKNNMQLPDQVSTTDDEYFPRVYACYQKKLKEYNALDFDDLLFLTVRLFREHPDILAHYQLRWRYLLIDEYQDTNHAQYDLVRHLVSKHYNICVVGDPDQSIYSWRGANIRNILDFEKDYPGAKIVRLDQNYRSRSNILEAANAVVSRNFNRYEKHLWSDLGPGEKIKHFSADTERVEADFVIDRIRYHHEKDGIPLNDMVVFYRTNAQSRAFEDHLMQKRIPYVIVGGVSFYQRREIKDILSFLRMVQSGNDYVSFTRTLNIPKRGLGDTTIEKIRIGASHSGLSILSYCENLIEGRPVSVPTKLTTKQRDGLGSFLETIRNLKKVHEQGSLSELVQAAIQKTDYEGYIREDKETYEDRKQNLDSLVAKAMDWESTTENPSLEAFLEELSLRSTLDEADDDKEHINLMTIHNGKGLEFTVTFLVGLEEELFPHANSRGDPEGVEEERRLFYVGMTRAKEYLYLTDSKIRFLWGASRTQRTSRFIKEIPYEYVEKVRLSSMPYVRPPKYKREMYQDEVEEKFSDEQRVIHEPVVQNERLASGDAVFHKEFGVGIVQNIYQGSAGLTYRILFSKDHRERNLVAKYAHLLKL